MVHALIERPDGWTTKSMDDWTVGWLDEWEKEWTNGLIVGRMGFFLFTNYDFRSGLIHQSPMGEKTRCPGVRSLCTGIHESNRYGVWCKEWPRHLRDGKIDGTKNIQ